jgi:hypothetical protein
MRTFLQRAPLIATPRVILLALLQSHSRLMEAIIRSKSFQIGYRGRIPNLKKNFTQTTNTLQVSEIGFQTQIFTKICCRTNQIISTVVPLIPTNNRILNLSTK